jgi:lipopolysaccharide transport system ATP-binding protein
MSTAVEVNGVSKRYVRGVQRGGTQLLSRAMLHWGQGLLRDKGAGARLRGQPFWALRDVSFAIEQGQVVGIIGRNGSGKSTLLKIISQITAPTTGEVRLRGRTGTLLEVGTGFHPELTGRENVFLNGAILGMSRAEIARKFDEIVAFSGVEGFIDTPVKRYSSGMQTRLAFSVAAHLEPEILIVDEVLAVGDAEFQKKCLGKMNEVSKEGRTIFFVSHNMSALDELCDRIIWIDAGTIVEDTTDTYAATSKYLFGDKHGDLKGEAGKNDGSSLETEYFSFVRFRVSDASGNTITAPTRNDATIDVEIEVFVKRPHPFLLFGYGVFNESGDNVYCSASTDTDDGAAQRLKPGLNRLRSRIPSRLLNQGLYRLDFMALIHNVVWYSRPGMTAIAAFLRIEGGLSDSTLWVLPRPGVIAPVLDWDIEAIAPSSDFPQQAIS